MVETIYMITVGVLLIFSVISGRLYKRRAEAYKELYREQSGAFDAIHEYCLKSIMKMYCDNEDYKEAERCKKIIDKLEANKRK
jgi:ketol-acid reductoisomerase